MSPRPRNQRPLSLSALNAGRTSPPDGQQSEELSRLRAENQQLRDSLEADLQRLSLEAGEEGLEFHRCSLDAFAERPIDTQPIRPEDISRVAASLAEVGLLSPILVDREWRPLAGKCRLAALRYLQQEEAAIFEQRFAQGIPCFRVCTVSWDEDPHQADHWMFTLQGQRQELRGKARDRKIIEVYERMKQDPRADFSSQGGRRGQQSYSGFQRLAAIFHVDPITIRRAIHAHEEGGQARQASSTAWQGWQQALRQGRQHGRAIQRLVKDMPDNYPQGEALQRQLQDFLQWCEQQAREQGGS